jgi:hypothetical protein
MSVIVHQRRRTDWLHVVQAEYMEMPGLQLTLPQVRRMWGLDDESCRQLLEQLVTSHFLRLTANDRYMLDGVSWTESD